MRLLVLAIISDIIHRSIHELVYMYFISINFMSGIPILLEDSHCFHCLYKAGRIH